jgi:hypothetical protein
VSFSILSFHAPIPARPSGKLAIFPDELVISVLLSVKQPIFPDGNVSAAQNYHKSAD